MNPVTLHLTFYPGIWGVILGGSLAIIAAYYAGRADQSICVLGDHSTGALASLMIGVFLWCAGVGFVVLTWSALCQL